MKEAEENLRLINIHTLSEMKKTFSHDTNNSKTSPLIADSHLINLISFLPDRGYEMINGKRKS